MSRYTDDDESKTRLARAKIVYEFGPDGIEMLDYIRAAQTETHQ